MRSILSIIFQVGGVILFVSGVGLLVYAARKLVEAAGMKHWPTTPGRIISSDVHEVTRRVQFGDEPERTVQEHKVEVRYEYEVKNVVFSGIDVGENADQTSSQRWAYQRADRYKPGADVTVHYSPKDPTRSVLEPGIGSMTYLPAVIAVVMMVTGMALFVISRTWLAP